MRPRIMGIAIAVAFAAVVPAALAQHEHEKGQEHAKPAKFTMPTTYRQAVQEIQNRLAEIDKLIKAKHLDNVHPQADVIKQVGNQIGQLAAKPDSGVPKDAVKEVNQAGRALAAKFDAIDKVADAGDAAGTQREYDEMVKLTATLAKYIAKTYQCPMKCEGDKTYSAPGRCPKCGMDLKEIASLGSHGGLVAFTADRKRQVELTLSKDNDVRIYFYDEQAKPFSADHVTAQAHAGKKGSKETEHKPVTLTLDSSKSFLSGKVDAASKPPLTLMVTVDFKDGSKAETITFECDAATKAGDEHKEHKGDEHKGHKP